MATLVNGDKGRLDSVGDIEDDRLSDIEDVVDKVTDQLGLFIDKINPIVDPDKVLLDLSPEDEDSLRRSFNHIDFPVKNLVELVHINKENCLKDASAESFSSNSSYDVVPDVNDAFNNPDTPPDTPTKEDIEPSKYGPESAMLIELKRQTSEALSEKVVETMEAITDILSGLEESEGFRIVNEAYVLETDDHMDHYHSNLVLEAESLSDSSHHEDAPNAQCVEDTSELLSVKREPALSDKDNTDGTDASHHNGCETCEELSAESFVSEPEPLITVTALNVIAVNSQPVFGEEQNEEVHPSSPSLSSSDNEDNTNVSVEPQGELYKPKEAEISAKPELHDDFERSVEFETHQLTHIIVKQDSAHSSSSSEADSKDPNTALTPEVCTQDEHLAFIYRMNTWHLSTVAGHESVAVLNDVDKEVVTKDAVDKLSIDTEVPSEEDCLIKLEASPEYKLDSESEANMQTEHVDSNGTEFNHSEMNAPDEPNIEEIYTTKIISTSIVSSTSSLSPDERLSHSSQEDVVLQMKQEESNEIIVASDEVATQLEAPSEDQVKSAYFSSDEEDAPHQITEITLSAPEGFEVQLKDDYEIDEINVLGAITDTTELIPSSENNEDSNVGLSIEESIPIPSAVLKRSESSRSSSSSSSSSDSDEAEMEFTATDNLMTYEALSDHSSLCSESDLRESMQRFQDINMALNKSDCEARENESPGTELEVITPDFHFRDSIDYHNSTVEAGQEFEEEIVDIHIPLSVILSNESSRKSSKASMESSRKSSYSRKSSSSSSSSDKKLADLPSPRVIADKDAIDILMSMSFESDDEHHTECEPDRNSRDHISHAEGKDSFTGIADSHVKAFVDCQIETAVAKTLVDDQIAAVINSEANTHPIIPSELSKHDSIERIPEQIVIVNSTFGILSDVPDIQIDIEKIKSLDDPKRKYSDSSSDHEIPRIHSIELKDEIPDRSQFSPSSTLSSHSDDHHQPTSGDDIKIDAAKSFDWSEDLKSSSAVSSNSSVDLAGVIDLNSESIASSSDCSIRVEESVGPQEVADAFSAVDDKHDISIISIDAHKDNGTFEGELDGKIGKDLSDISTDSVHSKTISTDFTEVTTIIDLTLTPDERFRFESVDNEKEKSIETDLHVHTPDILSPSVECSETEDLERGRYGVLKISSEAEIGDQSSEDERYAKIDKDSHSHASSETDSDNEKSVPLPSEDKEDDVPSDKSDKTPVNLLLESETIDKVLMVNTPDLLDDDDDSLSEEEGFCQSDALQSILDRMTSSTISVTEDRLRELETEQDTHSTSSSSSRSTVAKVEDEDTAGAESPEPPSDPSGLTSSPEPCKNEYGSDDFATPEPLPHEQNGGTVDEPLETSTPISAKHTKTYNVQKQESVVASETLLLLSNSSEEAITSEPFSATLISSSRDSMDLTSSLKKNRDNTFVIKDKLFLKTKFPSHNPVVGKSFLVACKVKMTGFTLKPKDVKNNAQIRLYRDQTLLTIQPKFRRGYFIYKVKNPTFGESGVYKFVVNLLEYEAEAEEDLNIVVKGVNRSKSMSSVGSLGSLGSLFNNRTSGKR